MPSVFNNLNGRLFNRSPTPSNSLSANCNATLNSKSVSPPNVAPRKHPSFLRQFLT